MLKRCLSSALVAGFPQRGCIYIWHVICLTTFGSLCQVWTDPLKWCRKALAIKTCISEEIHSWLCCSGAYCMSLGVTLGCLNLCILDLLVWGCWVEYDYFFVWLVPNERLWERNPYCSSCIDSQAIKGSLNPPLIGWAEASMAPRWLQCSSAKPPIMTCGHGSCMVREEYCGWCTCAVETAGLALPSCMTCLWLLVAGCT